MDFFHIKNFLLHIPLFIDSQLEEELQVSGHSISGDKNPHKSWSRWIDNFSLFLPKIYEKNEREKVQKYKHTKIWTYKHTNPHTIQWGVELTSCFISCLKYMKKMREKKYKSTKIQKSGHTNTQIHRQFSEGLSWQLVSFPVVGHKSQIMITTELRQST